MRVWTVRKLADHPYAQCHVETDYNGDINFVSYATTVIMIRGQHIFCTGTYSQTTAKQIGWFLREYFPRFNYYGMKELARLQMWEDIYTGERTTAIEA